MAEDRLAQLIAENRRLVDEKNVLLMELQNLRHTLRPLARSDTCLLCGRRVGDAGMCMNPECRSPVTQSAAVKAAKEV